MGCFGDLAQQIAARHCFTGQPSTRDTRSKSRSSSTARMNASVALTELLAFWKKMDA